MRMDTARYVVALLEERELVQSLGATYEAYRRRVPMFVPKLRGGDRLVRDAEDRD
jgi:protein-S-isoprenylcysteine O-methyltransferase Ste14